MICHEREFIFFHVPKTAGLTMEHVLFPELRFDGSTLLVEDREHAYGWSAELGWLQHLTPAEMIANGFISPDQFRRYFKFGFVRNPWDRLVSEYVWKLEQNRLGMPFLGFIETVASSPATLSAHYMSAHACRQHLCDQATYLCEPDGELLVDFVGRFEQLQDGFDYACDRIGISRQQLPVRNATRHLHYSTYYDEQSRELAARCYARDIDRFSYSWPSVARSVSAGGSSE